jgi:lysophospholipase L1-like esterase
VDVRARVVVPLYKPNVVLINAGTNDATQNYYVGKTKDRMRGMIDFIFSTVPDVCVVLSTLIPNTLNPGNVATINDQYRALASELQGQGKRLVLVDFGDGWMTTADLADTTVSTPCPLNDALNDAFL